MPKTPLVSTIRHTIQCVRSLCRLVSHQPKVQLVDLGYPNVNEGPVTYSTTSVLSALQTSKVPANLVAYPVNRHSLGDFSNQVRRRIIANPNADVACGVYIWNTQYVAALNHEIAQARSQNEFHGKFILGGPMATYTPLLMSRQYDQSNFMAIGFSEWALSDFYHGQAQDAIIPVEELEEPGRLKRADNIHLTPFKTTPMRTYIDLNYPFLLALGKIYGSVKIRATLTQVGCAFRCSFCQWPGGGQKRQFLESRLNDISDILKLEASLRKKHIILDLSVNDAVFNSGAFHIKALDQLIQGGFKGKLSLQCRPEMIKRDFLERVVQLNKQGAMTLLEFGIQTYNRAENKAIYRQNNFKKIPEKIDLIYQVEQETGTSIPIEFSIIYGLPLQTVQSFKSTITSLEDLSANLNFGTGAPIIAFPLSFLPGTALEREKDTYGFKLSPQPDSYHTLGKAHPNVLSQELFGISSNSFTIADYQKMTQIAVELNAKYDHMTHQRDFKFGLFAKQRSVSPSDRLLLK